MNIRRTAAASLSAFLVLGGAGVVSAAADTTTTTSPDPTSTTVPADPTPQDFSVTLAGLGDVTVTVDPTTGAIQNVVVTPIDGVTAGTPVPVENGIRIDFTLADGTVKAVVLEVEAHKGRVEVEVAGDHHSEDSQHQGPPAIEDRGESADHRQDDQGHNGSGSGTTPSTQAPAGPTTTRPSDDGSDHSSSNGSSGSDGSSHGGRGGSDGRD
jgi:hypothetical protein